MLPQFLRPGRFSYIVEYPRGTYYFHKGLIDFRKEPIVREHLRVGRNDDSQSDSGASGDGTFKVQASVFWDWRGDTDQILNECLNHDLRHLDFTFLRDLVSQPTQQLGVTVQKQPGEGNNDSDEAPVVVQPVRRLPDPVTVAADFVEEHFVDLKYVYMNALSESKLPSGVDLPSLQRLLLDICKVPCLTEEMVVTAFNAAVQDPVVKDASGEVLKPARDPQKPVDVLCRKEFFEVFTRLAAALFSNRPFVGAMKTLLYQNLLPQMPAEHCRDCYVDFRTYDLYSREVDAIFQSNQDEISRVLSRYGSKLTFNSIVSICMIDSEPPICTDLQVLVRAAAMAKMTVVKDYELEWGKMLIYTNSEFYELLARLVEIQSRGTMQEDYKLTDKLEQIIPQLLSIGHFKGDDTFADDSNEEQSSPAPVVENEP